MVGARLDRSTSRSGIYNNSLAKINFVVGGNHLRHSLAEDARTANPTSADWFASYFQDLFISAGWFARGIYFPLEEWQIYHEIIPIIGKIPVIFSSMADLADDISTVVFRP